MNRLVPDRIAVEAVFLSCQLARVLDDPNLLDAECAHLTLTKFSAGAWKVLFRVDHCSVEVRDLLASRRALGSLNPEVRAVLDHQAQFETMRALVVRGQIRAIGKMAERIGCQVAGLKGAIDLMQDGSGAYVGDIDLLVRQHEAHVWREVLLAEGYQQDNYGGSPLHLAAFIPRQGVPVEIHLNLPRYTSLSPDHVWAGIQPVPGVSGLHQLHPRDHTWHILTHWKLEHPWRRYRLRDTARLRIASRKCSGRDLREIETRIEMHPDAELLRGGFLGSSGREEDLAKRAVMTLADCHLGAAIPLRWIPAKFRSIHGQWISALVGEKRDRHRTWATAWERSHDAAAWPMFRWVEKLAPRATWYARVALRLAMRSVALATALPTAIAIKHTAIRCRPATP